MSSPYAETISERRKKEFLHRRISLLKENQHRFLLTVFVLLALGLLALFSASTSILSAQGKYPYSTILKQAGFVVVSLVVMLALGYAIVPRLSRQLIRIFVIIGFGISLVLVGLTYFSPFSSASYGASRWISLFGVRFQPSEFLKLTLPLFLTSYLINLENSGKLIYIRNEKGNYFSEARGTFPSSALFAAILISTALLALQPHLGQASLIFFTSLATLWLMGVPLRSILKFFLVMLLAGAVLYFAFPEKFEHVKKRFTAFLDPTRDVTGESYQTVQSLGAISRGGILGRGYMQGHQKYGRLPLSDRDFIFAVWTEEMGLVGAVFVIFLFIYLLILAVRMSALLPYGFESVSISALTFVIVIQALVNISANVNVLPVSGLTLPFFSYGGSSMLSTLATVGIVIGLARRPYTKISDFSAQPPQLEKRDDS